MSIVEPARALPLAQAGAAYRVRITTDYVARDWSTGEATLFQRGDWLTPLYGSIAEHAPGVAPLFAELRDEAGALAMRLPLIRRKAGGLRVIEFADLNMSDFNGPLLGPAAPATAAAAKQALRALKQALPPHDLLRLVKMPAEIGGKPNPLLLAARPMLSAANGNLVTLGADWNDYHFSLEKTVRKELERSWRVFSREPGTALRVYTDPAEALALLETMEQVQRARIESLGQFYGMEQPVTAGLYRRLLADVGGYPFLTALTANGEMVASLLGLRDGETYLMIRLVHAGGSWSKVSPGRLLIHKTMEMLHGQGYRRIDFSIGNYAYKRRFGPVRTPLYDVVTAATPLGAPALLRARAGAFLRQFPQARETVRRMLGKQSLREEN